MIKAISAKEIAPIAIPSLSAKSGSACARSVRQSIELEKAILHLHLQQDMPQHTNIHLSRLVALLSEQFHCGLPIFIT